jgi:hypothetical protein
MTWLRRYGRSPRVQAADAHRSSPNAITRPGEGAEHRAISTSPAAAARTPRAIALSSAGLDRGTLVVAGVVTVGLLMAVLDTTIVNVALDSLSRDLGVGLGTIRWVSTGYLLSLAAVIPLSGWVTERFGSKSAGSEAGGMFARVPAAERERIAGPLARAFGHTFAWAVAMAAVALLSAVALLRAERTSRRSPADRLRPGFRR